MRDCTTGCQREHSAVRVLVQSASTTRQVASKAPPS